MLGDKTSSFLFCCCPPSSCNPNSSLPPHPLLLKPSRKEGADAIDTSQQVDGGVTLSLLACDVVLNVLVRRLTGVGMEFVGEEEQEVVLTLSLLLE